jgi:hypothetical protein
MRLTKELVMQVTRAALCTHVTRVPGFPLKIAVISVATQLSQG